MNPGRLLAGRPAKEGQRMDLSQKQLLWMYERMQLIRTFENRVKVEFGKGKIPGFVHLYAGEEAVAVGICAHLTDAERRLVLHDNVAELYGLS